MNITKSRIATTLVGLVVLAEVLVQLSGAVNVPVYEANNQIGYIPAPNQSGSFLHKNDYRFNELSMAAGPFKPDAARFNVLLIGDSVVLGGNPLSEPDRLGPQLEKLTGWQVWPISAGSWALQNELTYMRQHPEVLQQVDAVVFLANGSDFGQPSSWANELTHPRSHPFPGALFFLRKYVLHTQPPPVQPDMQVATRDWRADLKTFSQGFSKPTFVFMYPSLGELQDKASLQENLHSWIPVIQTQLASHARIFKVADHPQWVTQNYRDGVHTNGTGSTALAKIIYTDLCRNATAKMGCSSFKAP